MAFLTSCSFDVAPAIARDVAEILMQSGQLNMRSQSYVERITPQSYEQDKAGTQKRVDDLDDLPSIFARAHGLRSYLRTSDTLSVKVREALGIELQVAIDTMAPLVKTYRYMVFDLQAAKELVEIFDELTDMTRRIEGIRKRHLAQIPQDDKAVTSLIQQVPSLKGKLDLLDRLPQRFRNEEGEIHLSPAAAERIRESRGKFDLLVQELAGIVGEEKVRMEDDRILREKFSFGETLYNLDNSLWTHPDINRVRMELEVANVPMWFDIPSFMDGIPIGEIASARKEHQLYLADIRIAIQEWIADLPEVFRNAVYGKVYELSPEPKGGDRWGEFHVVDNLAVTQMAFDEAIKEHPEFEPKQFLREEVSYGSSDPSDRGISLRGSEPSHESYNFD